MSKQTWAIVLSKYRPFTSVFVETEGNGPVSISAPTLTPAPILAESSSASLKGPFGLHWPSTSIDMLISNSESQGVLAWTYFEPVQHKS